MEAFEAFSCTIFTHEPPMPLAKNIMLWYLPQSHSAIFLPIFVHFKYFKGQVFKLEKGTAAGCL